MDNIRSSRLCINSEGQERSTIIPELTASVIVNHPTLTRQSNRSLGGYSATDHQEKTCARYSAVSRLATRPGAPAHSI
ncbi:MAG TPA: hypothetical protein VGD98_11975 [Ktedonobacteraceae bacterium]